MKIRGFAVAASFAVLFTFVSTLLFSPVQAQTITPTIIPSATPTYDPFAEPPLPENPTQLESGRYLFWRYCMPCHGDVGQGLTDSFRREWDPEHQNCWERGCHSGRYADDSFPVPTLVPALMQTDLFTRFTSDSLFAFLRKTHPPEAPGSLTDDDYRALIAYLHELNGATQPSATPLPSFTPTPQRATRSEANSSLGLWSALGLALVLIALLALRSRRSK